MLSTCVTPGTSSKYLGEVVYETGIEAGTINLQLVSPGATTFMFDCLVAPITLTDVDGLVVNVVPRKNADIAPCGGDGRVDLDDILRVLAAFAGNDDCPGVGAASCCSDGSGTATAGCLDQAIARCVCDADSFCCTTKWDNICVGEVESEGCGYCP